jgi:hypothetical protein
MTKSLRNALKIVQDYDCYRVGPRIIVKQTGVVATEDAQKILDRGWVALDPSSSRVTITEGGRAMLRKGLNHITIAKGQAFIERYDRFFLFGEKLTANNGADHISLYVAEHFIQKGTLVPLGEGLFVRAQTTIVVYHHELDAVRGLLARLRS